MKCMLIQFQFQLEAEKNIECYLFLYSHWLFFYICCSVCTNFLFLKAILKNIYLYLYKEDRLSVSVSLCLNALHSFQGTRLKLCPSQRLIGTIQGGVNNFTVPQGFGKKGLILSFISMIIERSAYLQMIEYLHGSNLLPEKQSAYRKCHSTETVLLDILSDVSSAADNGQVTLLGLLDPSSAFDVIDHLILLERLHHDFGFSGQVLNWVRSYLTGRSQRVYFNGISSSVTLLMCGVPQGSVLGPLLFILYTAEILSIVESFGFHAHSYADDLQIYAHSDPKEAYTLVASFSDCVDAIKEWMASNHLRLNPDKTEVIWLGSPRRLHHCPKMPMVISGAMINHPPKFAILVSRWTATYRWRNMSINWSVCVSFTYASYDWCDPLWLSIRHTLWCVQWCTVASIIVKRRTCWIFSWDSQTTAVRFEICSSTHLAASWSCECHGPHEKTVALAHFPTANNI